MALDITKELRIAMRLLLTDRAMLMTNHEKRMLELMLMKNVLSDIDEITLRQIITKIRKAEN